MTRGPDLFGQVHEHEFSIEFRGYLMCSNFYCAAVVTADGQPLTPEQEAALQTAIEEDYL